MDPQFVLPTGHTTTGHNTTGHNSFYFCRIAQICLVLSICCSCVVLGLAANPHVILRQRSNNSRQNHPHTGVFWILGVEVTAAPCIFFKNLRNAESEAGKRRICLGIGRSRQHGSCGVKQFHHRIEHRRCLINIDPDFRSRITADAIDINVRRVIRCNITVYFKPHSTIVVSTFFLRRLPRIGSRCIVRSQNTEHLCGSRSLIRVNLSGIWFFRFSDDSHIRIV